MKVLLLLASALIAVQAYSAGEVEEKWADFKSSYEKQYQNKKESAYRKHVFAKNLKYIEEHNKLFELGLTTFTLGVNRFADLTSNEYSQMFKGFKQLKASEAIPFVIPEDAEIPDSIDWRTKGAVTPVKDQQNCGSCWSFSATGALEGAFFRKYGKLVSLSEQNLVDCSTENGGCSGGYPRTAFDYVKTNGGIATEDSYPYEGQDNTCRYNPEHSAGKVSGYGVVQKGSEESLKAAVATVGPISVAIDASLPSFQLYDGGLYDHPECKNDFGSLDHAVLVVGYNTTDDGKAYWLVKNSWGENYGDKGYLKMARNKNNQCGIATEATYPIAV